MKDLLTSTPGGLYCSRGNFYIDAQEPVAHNVVTHAHADHARAGSRVYYCSQSGAALLKHRLPKIPELRSHAFGEVFEINGVTVSLHPAGHLLGSAQVRVEYAGEVWVVSGDYKRQADPSCEEFELVSCDTFITEATFANPDACWKEPSVVFAQMDDWWRANAACGVHSLIEAYSLGKTQRILASLPEQHSRILLHPAAVAMSDLYRRQGIVLRDYEPLTKAALGALDEAVLIILPSQALKSGWLNHLGMVSRASASGWNLTKNLKSRRTRYDQAFVLSDHADWNDLLRTISETGARRVGLTHGFAGYLAEYLKGVGVGAFEV